MRKFLNNLSKMQVNRSTQIYSSLSPLNNILRVFALNCTYLENNAVKYTWSLARNVIIISMALFVNIISIYRKFLVYKFTETGLRISYTSLVQFTFLIGFAQYLLDLHFIRKIGKNTTLKYYDRYGQIDDMIKMNYYKIIRKTVLNKLVLFITLYIISSATDYLTWYLEFGWEKPTIYATEYMYLLTKLLTILDATSHIIALGYRLRTIADVIEQEIFVKSQVFTINGVFSIDLRNEMDSKLFANRNRKDLSPKVPDSITCLSRCYILLTKQIQYINSMYGLRILLSCLTLLGDMINYLNLIIRIIIGTMGTAGWLPALSSFLRLLTCAVLLFTLVHRCETVYRESERVKEIIDEVLVYKEANNKHLEVLKELQDLMKWRPICFHAVNFFRLDYTLLTAMTSLGVTYTIIFLQSVKSV